MQSVLLIANITGFPLSMATCISARSCCRTTPCAQRHQSAAWSPKTAMPPNMKPANPRPCH
jgi:hypothetical protein